MGIAPDYLLVGGVAQKVDQKVGLTHWWDELPGAFWDGVYRTRERIHRGVADPRLLATPPSRGRVADPDPN